MPDVRTVLVPDGLDGERVDAGVARLFGVSRTKAADLAADGHVVVDGKAVGEVRAALGRGDARGVPAARRRRARASRSSPSRCPGMTIVHDDDDIVVVDKPVGVAAHPSVGWVGPDVVGGLAAAGYRISTSGAPERQGIVSRLDVGTRGLMVVAKSEYAYSTAQAGLPQPNRRQELPRPRAGTARPARRHHRRADRASPRPRLQVRGHEERQAVGHALRGDRGLPAREPARHPSRDRAHAPDPGALRGAAPPVLRRPALRRGPRSWRRGWSSTDSGCTPWASASSTPARGTYVHFESAYPRTSSGHSTSSPPSEDLHPQLHPEASRCRRAAPWYTRRGEVQRAARWRRLGVPWGVGGEADRLRPLRSRPAPAERGCPPSAQGARRARGRRGHRARARAPWRRPRATRAGLWARPCRHRRGRRRAD